MNEDIETLNYWISPSHMFSPAMMIPYLVLICWIVMFVIHLKNKENRIWSGKVLICLSILLGILAPVIFIYGMFNLHRYSMASGAVDPEWFCIDVRLACVRSIFIAGLSALTLILSAWAWLMPGSIVSSYANIEKNNKPNKSQHPTSSS